MAEAKCRSCKKLFPSDEINHKTGAKYKTCQSCRKRRCQQDWQAVVFGNQPADNVSSDTESNATEHTLSPEETAPRQADVEQVEQAEQVEPQMTLNQTINTILNTLNDTSKDITNTIDGRDTSTKFVLERIRSDLTNVRMIMSNDADQSQFNRYELKLDKLASRMDNLEQVLHSRFSEIENKLSKQINGIRELI